MNERTQKAGKSPQYYIDTITEFKKILEPVTIKKIDAFLKNELHDTPPDEAYNILESEIPVKPVIGDWLYNVNILYWLVKGGVDEVVHNQLADAWLNKPIIDNRVDETVSNGEYLVLTDEEADDAWDDELEHYIDECLNIDEAIQPYFDREKWKDDARMDGRGHSLSSYDRAEHSKTVNEVNYYIYRQN